jgi:hypothetical protein
MRNGFAPNELHQCRIRERDRQAGLETAGRVSTRQTRLMTTIIPDLRRVKTRPARSGRQGDFQPADV